VNMETTFFVVKPEAVAQMRFIGSLLNIRRLVPHSLRHFVFEEHMLGIYPGLEMNPEIEAMCKAQMVGKRCILGLVTAPRAVERLLDTAGHDRNPTLCREGTIRRICGSKTPLRTAAGEEYWYNAIHRPKTIHEARDHAKFFGITQALLTV
jgi:hypothetical protein